jgi:indole-3-glycerol phosphate synthase
MTILENIIENKKRELILLKNLTSVSDLEKSLFFNRKVISLSERLLEKKNTGIIAEFKRKSPSRGIINSTSQIEEVTNGYFIQGAAGVSILTDTQFFGGSNADILQVRKKSLFPVLRKDFIIDEYQIIESKSIGADVILLIAAILEEREVMQLSVLARSLGMEVLLEIHETAELEKVNSYVNIIGVNNRNLKTFEVNTQISEKMIERIPDGFLKISESGIASGKTIEKLRSSGYNGFLIGDKFMNTADPVKAFSELVKEIN